MQWHSLHNIEEPETRCPETPAIYIITLPARGSIPRFLQQDGDCIVTIGSTKNMNQRRKQFLMGLKCLEGHSAGNLFNIINTACELKIRAAEFRLDYREHVTKEEAFAAESELTAEYMLRYGEAPPFNSIIPNRKDAVFWKAKVETMFHSPTHTASLEEWRLQTRRVA